MKIKQTETSDIKDFKDTGWTLTNVDIPHVTYIRADIHEALLRKSLTAYATIWRKLAKV